MIRYVTGSIFDSKADCLVNPVNCVGVMGKGLALEFKTKYPGMAARYKDLCQLGDLRAGRVAFYVNKNPKRIICMFPTKKHWRTPSTIGILDASFIAFTKHLPELGIRSAAFPMVGCGLGGLNFEHQVKPLMEKHLKDLDLDVEVYIT